MSAHTCHARGCETRVPPHIFMCRRHWMMLPKAMRDAIWATHSPGQETRRDPSEDYLRIAQECVAYVANKERVP